MRRRLSKKQLSINLVDWLEVATFAPGNGTVTFSDTNNLARCFYRVFVP